MELELMFSHRLLTGLSACAGVVVLSGAFAVLGGSGGFSEPAFAQQKATSGKANQAAPNQKTDTKFVASPWEVNCQPQVKGKELTCSLSQTIFVAKPRQRFVSISVRPWKSKDAPAPHLMVMQLPHGLALASGATFQVDDKKPQKLAMFTSDANGVYARIGLTKAILASIRKGKSMKVNFVASTGRKFILPIGLSGFSAGFDKLS